MPPPSLKLAVLDAPWSRPLVTMAQLRGHQVMVINPNGPSSMDPGILARKGWVLFARINQIFPEEGRNWALKFLSAGGKCVQSMEDIRCYENRRYQMDLLADYYPR